jgi:hypothetical protein
LALDFSFPSYKTALPSFESLLLTGIGAIFFGISGDFICPYILSLPRLKTGLVIFAVVFIASWTTLGFRIALLVWLLEPNKWFCLGSLLSKF